MQKAQRQSGQDGRLHQVSVPVAVVLHRSQSSECGCLILCVTLLQWQHCAQHAARAGDGGERKISRAGFDVTPLTAEQREAEAAKLTAFQR